MQYKQIAQAVMPPVGEYVARMVANALDARKKVKTPDFRLVEIYTDRVERRELSAATPPVPLRIGAAVPEAKSKPGTFPAASDRVKKAAKRPKAASRERPATIAPGTRPNPKNGGSAGFGTGRGSGYRIRELLLQKKSCDEILAVIHKEFPQSTAKPSDVSWNKRKLEQQGMRP
jgi:hypothetical protein